MNERVIAHVDMNAFFAAVEQQSDPWLRGRPIVVCGNPKTRTVVAACSYEAKGYGITNGMSIHEAKQLCPHVILVGGNPEKYVDVSQRIFSILAEFTPRMEVFSIDEAFLDLTETFHTFAPTPEGAARKIKDRIRRAFGLTCSVGIAPNKLIAKLASDLHKPDGLACVRPDEIPALMARLPVETLCGVGPSLKESLNDIGIITCADLGNAPESLLRQQYGVIGSTLKRMGQGADDSPVLLAGLDVPAKSMSHMYTLEHDTSDEREVFGTLLRLSERVARWMRRDGYQGRTVGLTVRYSSFATLTREETITYPTDSGLKIYQTVRELFDRHCEPMPQRVRLVGVGVSQLSRHQQQLSWLEDELQTDRLNRCIDQINNRFGELAVGRANAVAPLVSKTHGFLHSQRRGVLVS